MTELVSNNMRLRSTTCAHSESPNLLSTLPLYFYTRINHNRHIPSSLGVNAESR
jgi:hypothetical protein